MPAASLMGSASCPPSAPPTRGEKETQGGEGWGMKRSLPPLRRTGRADECNQHASGHERAPSSFGARLGGRRGAPCTSCVPGRAVRLPWQAGRPSGFELARPRGDRAPIKNRQSISEIFEERRGIPKRAFSQVFSHMGGTLIGESGGRKWALPHIPSAGPPTLPRSP
jgi:hypothetical protein